MNVMKRLDDLIREEHQAATALILKVTSGLKDGAQPHSIDRFSTPYSTFPSRRQQSQHNHATDSE